MEYLVQGVGMSAGYTEDDEGRKIPIIRLSFPRDEGAMDHIRSGGEYDADDGRWENYMLSVPSARRFLSELKDAVNIAIAGDDMDDMPPGWYPRRGDG